MIMQGNPFKMTERLTARKEWFNEYKTSKVARASLMTPCYQVANATLKKERINVFTETLLCPQIGWV